VKLWGPALERLGLHADAARVDGAGDGGAPGDGGGGSGGGGSGIAPDDGALGDGLPTEPPAALSHGDVARAVPAAASIACASPAAGPLTGAPLTGATAAPEIGGGWERARDRWVWAGLVAAVGLALWLTAPAWGGRPPGGDDVMGHLVRADWGLHHIILRHRLDGWFPRFMAGHQEYLLYGPAFDWVLASVRLVTLGRLSDAGAMKVIQIGSTVLIGPAVAYLGRSLGLTRRGAVLAAVLAYAVDSPFGVGTTATFVIGLVPHQAAAPLLCVALGACWRILDGQRGHTTTIAVAAMGGLLLLHPISVLVVAVLLALALAYRLTTLDLGWRALTRLVVSGAVTAGLTAFWLVPYITHRDLRGPVATWDTPSLHRRAHDILAGHILFGPGVGALVIVAAVAMVVLLAAGHRQPAVTVALPIAFVVIAHWLRSRGANEVSLLLANRGLGYAGLVAILPLAHILDATTDPLWKVIIRRGRRAQQAWSAAGDVLAVVAAVGIVVVPAHEQRVARQSPQATPAMFAAARELTTLVAPTARFAVERDFPAEIGRTGVTQPNLWLAFHSGRDELNVFNGESSASAAVGYTPDEIHTGDPAIAERLGRLGVSHVVTVDPASPGRLTRSGRFRLAWRSGPLAALVLEPPVGVSDPATLLSSDPDSGLSARPVTGSAEHRHWEVALARGSLVTAAIAWSPKWRASVGGHAIAVGSTLGPDRLIQLALPPGSDDVRLDYRPDAWDHAGEAVTLLSVVTLVGLGTDRRARRRRRHTLACAPSQRSASSWILRRRSRTA